MVQTDIILEGGNTEIQVTYEHETSNSQLEECHGWHEVGNNTYVELINVEVLVKGGSPIDILSQLSERQKENIISELKIW